MIPRWLPNALSAMRIALVPVWLALALVEPPRPALLLALLAIIGGTDMLDGFLARRFHLTTNLGATLDAVADKLASVVAVTFLVFTTRPAFTPLPLWLWLVLMTRDALLLIGFVTVWLKHGHVETEHRWHGRLATLILFATVVAAIAGAPAEVVTGGALAVCALVMPGTAAYLREGWRQLHQHGGRAAKERTARPT